MPKYGSFSPTIKYVIKPSIINHYKRHLHFFSFSITISGKNINFRHKKFRKRDFYENQKVFKIDDIDVDKKITWHKQII